jgi:hypothetical protein
MFFGLPVAGKGQTSTVASGDGHRRAELVAVR